MLAIGCLELDAAEILADSADVICAMTLDALRGTPRAFDPRLHASAAASRPGGKCRAAAAPVGGQRNPAVAHHLPARAGRLFAALRAAGAWRGARCAGRRRAASSPSS